MVNTITMDINKVTLHVDFKEHFEKFLKNDIVSIHTIGLSYDNGQIYYNFPTHKELINSIDTSLMRVFFEFLFNRFGRNRKYFYSEDNEGYNIRVVKRNHAYDSTVCNLDLIKNIFNLNGIPEENLLVQTSNLNAQEDWPYGFVILPAMPLTIFKYPEKEYTQKTFNKKFIFLNRNHKQHRCWLYEQFDELKILDNFYYSINSAKHPHYHLSIPLDGYDVSDVTKALVENSEFLNKSFCNVVTESEYFSNNPNESAYKSIFITEKTMKPINNYQPFIIVSGYGTLHKLKGFGFKTFDKWWDESYDLIQDDYERLRKILELVKSINELPFEKLYEMQNEMKDILIHNYELYCKFKNREFHYNTTFPFEYKYKSYFNE